MCIYNTHTYTYTCIYVYIYIYIYTCIYTYLHVYIYMYSLCCYVCQLLSESERLIYIHLCEFVCIRQVEHLEDATRSSSVLTHSRVTHSRVCCNTLQLSATHCHTLQLVVATCVTVQGTQVCVCVCVVMAAS